MVKAGGVVASGCYCIDQKGKITPLQWPDLGRQIVAKAGIFLSIRSLISRLHPSSSPEFHVRVPPLHGGRVSWVVFAFSGPVLWAISVHLDKYLVERFFKESNVAVIDRKSVV